MAFDYDEIFKYPAVQYIPLQLYDERYKPTNLNTTGFYFDLYRPEDNRALNNKLQKLNLLDTNYNIRNNQIAILVLNGKVDFIKYRGHEISMVGEIEPGYFQLFKITDEYFYKDRLVFIFYNSANSKRLDQKTYEKARL